jgi:hypothetical protein
MRAGGEEVVVEREQARWEGEVEKVKVQVQLTKETPETQ